MSIYPHKTLPYEPYVYFIGWSHLNIYYIGCKYGIKNPSHPSQFWVTYFTSSKLVKKFREVNGEPDIIRIEKTFTDAMKCLAYEYKLLVRMNSVKDPRFLNKSTAGEKFMIDHHTEKTREKLRIAWKTRAPMSEETRQKISISLTGRIRPPTPEETRQKMSISAKNKPPITEETRQKMSISQQNRPSFSEETRQKIGTAAKNAKEKRRSTYRNWSEEKREKYRLSRPPTSEETRQKISVASKNISDATRLKMSISQQNRPPFSEKTRQKLSDAAKSIKRPEITCPHCNKIGTGIGMYRWHFDNCKFKPT